MLSFFSTIVAEFNFDVKLEAGRLPESSMLLPHNEAGQFRMLEVTRGLIKKDEINTFVPKGGQLTKAICILCICTHMKIIKIITIIRTIMISLRLPRGITLFHLRYE